MTATEGFKVNGANALAAVGNVVDGCDINGDGLSDVFISSLEGSGYVKVIYGQENRTVSDIDLLSPLTPAVGFTISGITVGDKEGFSVACAGDANGDGIQDLISASPYATGAGRAGAGVVRILYGALGTRSDFSWSSFASGALTGYKVFGAATGVHFGYSVASAGDMNGDGRDEVIMGKNQSHVQHDHDNTCINVLPIVEMQAHLIKHPAPRHRPVWCTSCSVRPKGLIWISAPSLRGPMGSECLA